MQVLVCISCGKTGEEPDFHDEVTEQWRCPVCQMDESGIMVSDTALFPHQR